MNFYKPSHRMKKVFLLLRAYENNRGCRRTQGTSGGTSHLHYFYRRNQAVYDHFRITSRPVL